MHKKFLMLATAALAVGLLAIPATASAATGECTFGGVAGNINPGVQWEGGGGSYSFTSGVAGTVCRSTLANGNVPTTATISSTGGFTNEICGTGRAFSNAGTHTTTIKVGATTVISSATYSIDFHGGHGLLKIAAVNGSAEDSTSQTAGPKDPTDDTEIDGYVNIIPTADPENPSACLPVEDGGTGLGAGVTQFQVTGALRAAW